MLLTQDTQLITDDSLLRAQQKENDALIFIFFFGCFCVAVLDNRPISAPLSQLNLENEHQHTEPSVIPVKSTGSSKRKRGFHLILIPTFHPRHVCLQAAGVCSGFISRVRPDTCGDDMYEGMKVELRAACVCCPSSDCVCVCVCFGACVWGDRRCGVSCTLYIELQESVHWYSARVRLFLLQSSLQSGRHSRAHTLLLLSAHSASWPFHPFIAIPLSACLSVCL